MKKVISKVFIKFFIVIKIIILKLLVFYKKYLFFGNHCRFYPTCSQYTYQKVDKYGVIKGLLMGFKRILKCNPWC